MKRLFRLNLLFYLGFSLNSCIAKQYISTQDSNAVKILKKFAENYHPNNKVNELPEMLPIIALEIKNSIYQADSSGEQYLTLILLKLYKVHLECCNQSYELRPDSELDTISNPILDEFLKITQLYDSKKTIEFIPSSIAYDWIIKHPYLCKYSPINIEMNEIKKLKQTK